MYFYILDQISQILKSWEINKSIFVETRASKHVLECIKNHNCVTITASSGVGKTEILRHVALKMREEKYDVLIITNPNDIVNFYNPNQKTLFVLDDFCGTYSINLCYLNNMQSIIERIRVLIENKLTKIIVACRLQVYQDDKFESLSIFRSCVCNLHSKDLCLSKKEKTSIAEKYLVTRSSEIIQYCDLFECFPLLCKLYQKNPEHIITEFFQNPFSVFETEIDELQKQGHFGKYCVLALCVMFNNSLPEELFTDKINSVERSIIENTCHACKLDRGTSTLILLDELKSLEHTFIKKEQGEYRTIHDKIFDFLVSYFGPKIIHCVITYSHPVVIMQRFLLKRTNDIDQFITIVPAEYHEMYIQRMIVDWANGLVVCVFNNINMKIPEFRQRFLSHLNTYDNTFQRQLSQTRDVVGADTVLLLCCQYDDISFIQWCLHNGVDVNQCNSEEWSPLHIATEQGHTRVVELLLNNKADFNKCICNGESPLMVACSNDHTEIVKLLLETKSLPWQNNITVAQWLFLFACLFLFVYSDFKTLVGYRLFNSVVPPLIITILFSLCYHSCVGRVVDTNKCTNEGGSPLFIACQNNNIEIVKLLLKTNTLVDNISYKGRSPLFIACMKGYLDIVKILLGNKADVNKCPDEGPSPLFNACCSNHTEIVKLLLDMNADVNKSNETGSVDACLPCDHYYEDVDGASPLFSACCNTNIEMVKILLDKNADTNKCLRNGSSPLFMVCQTNHIEIAKLLLDNKADVNKCLSNGISPLFVASYKNNIETVKLLLDNQANINKCDNTGMSPLFIACVMNNKETVNILLENNADINKCTKEDESPLFIACSQNHVETVKLLLENNADIYKCTKQGISPMYIATANNNIETVRILLKRGAKPSLNMVQIGLPMTLYIDEALD